MKESISLSPPNSLIFVMDHKAGVLPDQITEGLVATTASCVAIGTLSEVDGETTITLTDNMDGVEAVDLVFSGSLSTPNHELSVCDVNNEKLLTLPVSQTSTMVKIFANDSSEPDYIVVFAK
jgi:hypothetical protein